MPQTPDSDPDEGLIPLEDQRGWAAALSRVEHSYAHTWIYCNAVFESFRHPVKLYFRFDGNTALVCPIMERFVGGAVDIATLPGIGGLAGHDDIQDAGGVLANFFCSRRYVCGYLAVHPLLHPRGLLLAEMETPLNTAYVLDLTLSEAQLFSSMSANRRRHLRGERLFSPGLTFDKDRIVAFVSRESTVFLQSRRASKESYLSSDSYEKIIRDERVVAIAAEVSGSIEAVAIFGHTDRHADYLWGFSRQGCAGHSSRLVWQGLLQIKSRGVRSLNLGGGIRANDGVAEFKSRFGATKYPMHVLRQIYNRAELDRLCAGVSPGCLSARYFPPYRSPSS